LEDIYNNSKYIIFDEVSFNPEDLKLIDEKAKKIIANFSNKILLLTNLNKELLEPIVNDLIKDHETNFKGVGQPLRVALTGSKFGPGIYDIIISLGKDEIQKRLSSKIFS
jgi:glutamyl-tRNA synthetase